LAAAERGADGIMPKSTNRNTATSPLYAGRRRRNKITMGLSLAATAFGLGWLVLILGTLLWEGFSGLSLRVFTEMTPPPGSSGGLLNPIFGSLIMTTLAILVGTPIGIQAATSIAYNRRHQRPAPLDTVFECV